MKAKLKALTETKVGAFLLRLYKRYDKSNLALLAAALSYYAAFSLGPLLLLLAGWLGVVLRNRPEISGQYKVVLTDLISKLLPFQDNVDQLVNQSFEVILIQFQDGALLRSIISVLVLLWASSNFFTVLQLALEEIFDVPHIRGYWRKRLVAMLLVASVALVIGIEVVGGVINSSLAHWWNLGISKLQELNPKLPVLFLGWRSGLLTELLKVIISTLVFTISFRYLPKKASNWYGALFGALFSTGSIIILRFVLDKSFNPEQFNLIYGVITSLLIILLWLYFALLMFLTGALLAAEISSSMKQLNHTNS